MTFGLLTACRKEPITQESQLNSTVNLSDAALSISILETGKSDCIIIDIDGNIVMIDTGLDQNGNQIVEFLEREGIETIDYLIISHLDQDHIGGADIIFDKVDVSTVIQPNYTRETHQYNEYIKALEKHDLNLIYLTEDFTFDLNGATFEIFAPLEEEYELSNDYSLMTSLSYGEQNFLFAGDAETVRINEFLETNPSHYTLLKLPHHGKYCENIEELLATISPTYGIITCSDEEYADTEVLELLTDYEIQTLLTSDGPITIQSDGTSISVHQQLKKIISFGQKEAI
ncbi:MAG: MBL fold metallo-hydrolase [Turicibacter sp.]|nr:MBL fold metallo-hydrolase [Turicibacter sp.]